MPPRSCLTGLSAKKRSLTPVEQERIRLNAPRINAHALGRLMGRSPDALTRWAKANGVEFMVCKNQVRSYPAKRTHPVGIRVLPEARHEQNHIDRMMDAMHVLNKLRRAS